MANGENQMAVNLDQTAMSNAVRDLCVQIGVPPRIFGQKPLLEEWIMKKKIPTAWDKLVKALNDAVYHVDYGFGGKDICLESSRSTRVETKNRNTILTWNPYPIHVRRADTEKTRRVDPDYLSGVTKAEELGLRWDEEMKTMAWRRGSPSRNMETPYPNVISLKVWIPYNMAWPPMVFTPFQNKSVKDIRAIMSAFYFEGFSRFGHHGIYRHFHDKTEGVYEFQWDWVRESDRSKINEVGVLLDYVDENHPYISVKFTEETREVVTDIEEDILPLDPGIEFTDPITGNRLRLVRRMGRSVTPETVVREVVADAVVPVMTVTVTQGFLPIED